MTNSDSRYEYFNLAYQRGSDIWTHIPYQETAKNVLPEQNNALVLDIGCGRGEWLFNLIKENYRVLGLDYIESIISDINLEIKQNHLSEQGRAITGNILDIPFSDTSFDMLTDIGTFQHLYESERHTYMNELARVLKSGGYYLNISLSQNTQSFLGFKPKMNGVSIGEKFGLSYSFFKPADMMHIFGEKFIILKSIEETYPSQSDPEDSVTLLFTLMQKK